MSAPITPTRRKRAATQMMTVAANAAPAAPHGLQIRVTMSHRTVVTLVAVALAMIFLFRA